MTRMTDKQKLEAIGLIMGDYECPKGRILPDIKQICIDVRAVIDVPNTQACPKEKVAWLENSVPYQLSLHLFNKIRSRRPNWKQPNFQNWAKAIDYMLRRENRTEEGIKRVIDWCQQDDFWQSNILSTSKLRHQYDRLEEMMLKDKTFCSRQRLTERITRQQSNGRPTMADLLKKQYNFHDTND